MYLTKINEISINNKYTKWYINIIKTAIIRTDINVFELHHILPKSFDIGGEKDKNNLVKLTQREHFVCHKLLHRMMSDKILKRKMYFAIWQMSNRGLISRSSREYEKNRIAFSEIMVDLWQTESYRNKQSAAQDGKYSVENREANAARGRQYYIDNPEQKHRVVAVFREAHKNIDHSSDEWLDRSLKSKETKEKVKKIHQSDSHRLQCKIRELSKGADELSRVGKHRKSMQIEQGIVKYGSLEAYNKTLSDRIKGRKRIANLETLEIKNVHDSILKDGWVFWSNLSDQQKKLFTRK